MDEERLVIIGGSAAGAAAAQSAVNSEFMGKIHVISRDESAPYYRPALSKQLLQGTWDRSRATQEMPNDKRLIWEKGVGAVGLDVDERFIRLDDDRTVDFDRLILASGCRPRRIPSLPGKDLLPSVSTIHDVETVTSRLHGTDHVVVIGGGLIGSEVASTLSRRGVRVTVVDPSPTPLLRALGPLGDEICMQQHRSNGVDLRLGITVQQVTENGRGVMVDLDQGGPVFADSAVLCVGVVPDTEWLEDSGLSILADGAIECDANLIAHGTDVVGAAGDIASWESAREGRKMRVEHWLTAVEQGKLAARNVLLPHEKRTPFDSLPMFWSEQHGNLIHALGHHGPQSTWEVLEGTPGGDGMVAVASTDEYQSGYLLINAARRLGHYRQQMLDQRKELS